MNKIFIVLIFIAWCIASINANNLPICFSPMINNHFQPNTNFSYILNFTLYENCLNVTLSYSLSITTDSRGINCTNLELPQNFILPSYLCEYRNNSLRKVHNISSQIFNNVYANSVNVTNNITADTGFFHLAWTWITNIPNLIYGVLLSNNNNNLLISNGTAIGYDETVLNNSITNVGLNAGLNSTYNSTYNTWAYNQTTPAIDDVNSRFWNRTQAYNKSEIDSFNASWSSTYNSTYNQWAYNQTYSGSTYNATYNAYVTANQSNSSTWWNQMNSTNSTQIENNGGTFNIKESFLNAFGWITNTVSNLVNYYTKTETDTNLSLRYLNTNPSNFINSTNVAYLNNSNNFTATQTFSNNLNITGNISLDNDAVITRSNTNVSIGISVSGTVIERLG